MVGVPTPRARQHRGKQVNFTAFRNSIRAFNPSEDFLEVKAVTRVEDFEGAPLGWRAMVKEKGSGGATATIRGR